MSGFVKYVDEIGTYFPFAGSVSDLPSDTTFSYDRVINKYKVEAGDTIVTKELSAFSVALSGGDIVTAGGVHLIQILTGGSFDTIGDMSASEGLVNGSTYEVISGFNGESESFAYDSSSSLTADGALVVDATGMGAGRLISERTDYSSFDEFDGDVRTFAAGTSLSVAGVGSYEIASTGEHFTTSGGLKVNVLPVGGTFHRGAFGVKGDGSDEASRLQVMIDVSRGYRLDWGADATIRFDSQITVQSDGNSKVSTEWFGSDIVLESYVSGSIAGYDTAGFAILFDGAQGSIIGEGMTLDFSNGTAGYAIRCRKASSLYNRFKWRRVVGGSATNDRETVTKIAARYVGNEASASSTGNVNYYNTHEGCEMRIGYKLIDHVVGDGDASTRQPNANKDIDCQFSRYIVAVDWGDTDENSSIGAFFNSASGVSGIEGGYSYCYNTDGSLSMAVARMEPGADTKPYRIGSGGATNRFALSQNTSDNGDDNSTAQTTDVTKSNSIEGLFEVNNKAWSNDGDADVNFFCNGTNSHTGAGFQRVKIGSRNGNTDILSVGWESSTLASLTVPSNNAIKLSGSWETPIVLGSLYLWGESGKLYLKNGAAPSSGTDGTVAGTQT